MIRAISMLSALALGGCVMVPIPGSVIASAKDAVRGEHGEWCVPPTAQVGQKIRTDKGTVGTITSLNGPSWRCKGVNSQRADISVAP